MTTVDIPKKILVVADPSGAHPTAVTRGLEIAARTGADLDVVAFAFQRAYDDPQLTQAQQKTLHAALLDARREDLAEALATLPDGIGKVSRRAVWAARPGAWIRARGDRYDLVIKGVDPAASDASVFGREPLDWELLRELDQPLLLATQREWPRRACILAALDLSADDARHRRINRAVLQQAASLAHIYGATLHVCHVIEMSRVLVDLDIVRPRAHRKAVRERIAPALEALCEEFAIKPSNVHLPVGDIDREIDSVAGRIKAEAIVLGTTKRRGLAGRFIGSVAVNLVKHVNTDVLAVKP